MTPFAIVAACLFAAPLAFGPVAQEAVTADTKARTLVIYDVRDLASDVSETESPNGPAIEDLASLLRESVLGNSGAEVKVQASAGALVVVATPEEHRLLNEALTDFRRAGATAYRIDIRIVQAPASELAVAKGGALRVLDGSLEEETARFEGRANVLCAPRIVARPLQRAMLSVLNRVKFVKGYEVIEGLDGFDGALSVPEIGEFDDGVVVNVLVAPIPKNRERHVRVDLSAHVGRIERPIPVEASENGPVHKPVTTTHEVKTSVTLPLGTVVLLSTAGAPDGEEAAGGGESLFVLIEVRSAE